MKKSFVIHCVLANASLLINGVEFEKTADGVVSKAPVDEATARTFAGIEGYTITADDGTTIGSFTPSGDAASELAALRAELAKAKAETAAAIEAAAAAEAKAADATAPAAKEAAAKPAATAKK